MIGHHIDVIADHASQGAPDQPALAVLGGGELPKRYSHTHDPFVALSFAAAATRTLKLGNGVALVPQRARSSLPSRWRASTTVGRSVHFRDRWWVERRGNGEPWHPYETRFKLLRERVLAMKALWT